MLPGGVDYVEILQQSVSVEFTFEEERQRKVRYFILIVCKIDSLLFWYVNSYHCNISFCLSAPFKRSVGALEQQCTTISIISDECVEDDETFHLQLSTADESVMLNPATAYITIVNNDCKWFIDLCPAVSRKKTANIYWEPTSLLPGLPHTHIRSIMGLKTILIILL